MEKEFRSLDIEKDIGKILKEIYDSETHLKIEWMWDGGIEVSIIWSGKNNGIIGYHKNDPAKAIKIAYCNLKKRWAKLQKQEQMTDLLKFLHEKKKEERINKIWHLCDYCKFNYPTCTGNPIFMCDLYEVRPPNNDAIIFCDGFELKKDKKSL